MPADSNIDPELQFAASSISDHVSAATSTQQAPHPYYFQQEQQSAVAPGIVRHKIEPSPSPDEDLEHDEHGRSQNVGGGQLYDANGLPRRSRACDNCRRDKQKCEPSEDPTDAICKRCKRGNKNCFVTPSTKKRQKKENNAVSKLQEEVSALKAMIQGMHGSPPQTNHSPASYTRVSSYASSIGPQGSGSNGPYAASPGAESAGRSLNTSGPSTNPWTTADSDVTDTMDPSSRKRRRVESTSEDNRIASISSVMGAPSLQTAAASPAPPSWPPKPRKFDHSDLLIKLDEIVSPDAAEFVFKRYVQDVSTHFPVVPTSPGTTAASLRKAKPLLFLSIITCTCFSVPAHIISAEAQGQLGKLFIDQTAEYIWRNVEKSFEIVQALQIGVLWYQPTTFDQHNFYTMANTATSMALDLGSGKRASNYNTRMAMGPMRIRSPDADSVEGRRAFLCCYYVSMTMSMVLRRPVLLRWSLYLQECIDYLESSPHALPSDREICYHIKLSRLAEKIITEFKLEDPSDTLSLQDPKVVKALHDCRKELTKVIAEKPSANEQSSPYLLELMEEIINLYMHEIALYVPNNPEDFRTGATYPGDSSSSKPEGPQIYGKAHVDALNICLTSCHRILDAFITMPFEHRLVLPIMFSVRCIYSIVCLIKFWGAVTGPGQMRTLFHPEDLKVDYYIDRLIDTFRAIIERYPQAPHIKFRHIIGSLKERFKVIKEGGGRNPDGSLQFPCAMPPPPSQEDAPKTSMPPPNKNVPIAQQTPLHLLSEVAMGNSTPHQQQPMNLPYGPQQLQSQTNNSFIDPSFDVPSDPQFMRNDDYIDFSMMDFGNFGMLNADLSGLFMWDPLLNTANMGEAVNPLAPY